MNGNTTLTSIEIAPDDPSIAVGESVQFSALGSFSNGGTEDITSLANWFSSDITVATFDEPALATGQNAGTSQIYVAYEGLTSNVQKITVISKPPDAEFSADKTTGAAPLTVSFTDNSTKQQFITSWEWDFGDGATSIEQNPLHIYTTAGLYTISLTVTDKFGNGDMETRADYITVDDDDIEAEFGSDSNEDTAPLTVHFYDLTESEEAIISWQWDFGDGGTSMMRNPSHEYTQAGTYTVSMTVVDDEGDSDTETKAGYVVVSDSKPD
jgi:PKD repeat protein